MAPYYGYNCAKVCTPKDCSGHGVCDTSSDQLRCICEGDYIGTSCNINCNCNGHGEQTDIHGARRSGSCRAGSCTCDAPFYGWDCSSACNHNERWDGGICIHAEADHAATFYLICALCAVTVSAVSAKYETPVDRTTQWLVVSAPMGLYGVLLAVWWLASGVADEALAVLLLVATVLVSGCLLFAATKGFVDKDAMHLVKGMGTFNVVAMIVLMLALCSGPGWLSETCEIMLIITVVVCTAAVSGLLINSHRAMQHSDLQRRLLEIEEQRRQSHLRHQEEELREVEDQENKAKLRKEQAKQAKVVWECDTGGNGERWCQFDADISAKLEAAAQSHTTAKWKRKGASYQADFSTNVRPQQQNLKTKTFRPIRRSFDQWAGPLQVTTKLLKKSTAAWKEINDRVRESLPTHTVTRLESIHNNELLSDYHHHLEIVRNKPRNAGETNVRLAFHAMAGNADELKKIYAGGRADGGFDYRLGRAGAYGRGSYFAEHAIYSAYLYPRPTPEPDGSVTMLCAQVILGTSKDLGKRMDQSLMREPAIPGGAPGEVYDSVQGTEGSFGIHNAAKHKDRSNAKKYGADKNGTEEYGRQYIVYDKRAAYPKYLVTIKPS